MAWFNADKNLLLKLLVSCNSIKIYLVKYHILGELVSLTKNLGGVGVSFLS